jgi:hypothetical protein
MSECVCACCDDPLGCHCTDYEAQQYCDCAFCLTSLEESRG